MINSEIATASQLPVTLHSSAAHHNCWLSTSLRVAIVVVIAVLLHPVAIRAQTFDLADFANEPIISSGLTAPISLGFLPDNRMLVLEKGGEILIADPNNGNRQVYLDISSIVNSGQERGLLDIAIPPDFDPAGASGKNYIYLFYTRSSNTNRAVIGKFTHNENAGGLASRAAASSEEILWTDTDGFYGCCHYGGGLDFGPDGKIWLTSSDKFNTTNGGEGPSGGDNWPANLEHTSGKIIRINSDGSIPADNPFAEGNTTVAGPYPDASDPVFGGSFTPHPSIWAYGLRNPFRADWDAEYGYLYIGEVGGNQGGSWDDIHLASLDQKEVFYGWNFYEGVINFEPTGSETNFSKSDFPQPDADLADPAAGDYYSAPIYAIPHTSLTGGFVYRGNMFPDEFDGVYFFGNYETNYIKFLDLDATGTIVEGVYDFKPSDAITGNVSNVVFLEEGIDGALYYINYSGSGGQVQRVVYDGEAAPDITNFNVTDAQGDPNDGTGATAPLAVTFTATAADSDTDLSALTFSINFGDGTPSQNGTPDATTGAISVPHTYSTVGSFSAVMSVSDGVRSTLSTPIIVTVGDPNDAPVFLSAAADVQFGDPPLAVTFTATVSDADADDPVESLNFVLNFGDGTTPATGSPDASGMVEVQHTYLTPSPNGAFNAFFTISDGEAAPVSSETLPIQVGPASGLPVTDGLVFQVESFIKVGLAGDGTTVTEWLDESGQGNNLVAAGNPQYIQNATPSGEPAIELDGTGDFLVDAASLTGFSVGNEPRTLFFVVDYEAVTNNEYAGLVYGNSANNEAFGLTLEGNANDLTVQGWGGSNDRATNVNGVLDPATSEQRGFISHAVVFDGTTYTHYLNGEVIDTGAKTYATNLVNLLIGQNLNGGEVPLSVAAAFIYNKALDVSEFTSVENYIQSTYLTASENAQPIAVADSYNATSGELFIVPSSTGLLNNDIDDGVLNVLTVNGQPVGNSPFSLANGTLTVEPDGAFTYTSAANFVGNETFTYSITDGTLTDNASVSIEVSAPSSTTVPAAQNLVAYFESDINVLQTGGTVTEWLSGAGTNMDLVAAGDPVFLPNATPSGKGAISFDGIGDKLSRTTAGGQSVGPLPEGSAARTMYFVVDYQTMNGVFAGATYGKGSANDAFGLVLSGNNGLLTVQGWGGGNDYPVLGQNGIGDNDGSAGDDWFIHSVRYDGTTIRHYRDDQLIDTQNHTFTTATEAFVIGEEIAGAGFAALDVAALFLYDRELDDTEHAQVIQYLTNKYLNINPTDDTPPVITVLGDNPAEVTLGQSYVDAGATATDDVDGPVTVSTIGNTVDVNTLGTYLVTYSASDAANNTATATRSVNVVEDDSPGTDVPLAADLVLALESDAGITEVAGTVSAWSDQSGQGNDLASAGDPQIGVTTTPSGAEAIRLDGVGDWLDRTTGITGLPTGAGERTAFFVVNYVQTSAYAGFGYGTGAPNQAFGLTTNGGGGFLTLQGWGSGNDVVSTTSGVGAGWLVQSVVLAANGDYVHYKDGTSIDSGNRTYNTVLSRIAVGEEISGGGNGEEMDVAALLVYDRALTDLERQQVEDYLQNKYINTTPPANLAPVADNDASMTDEDTPVNIDVLDGDTDSDGTVAGVTLINGQTAMVDQPVILVSGATATLLADGTIDYDPNGQFEALNNGASDSDSFTYTIEDNDGAASNAATVTVTINGVTDQTGGGPGDNPVTSSLIASFESDFGIGVNAGAVTGWNDFFNTYNLTGVNGDPQLVPNGSPAGQDAIAFDGTDDFLRILGSDVDLSGLPGGAAPRTLYFVVDYKTIGEFTGFGYGDNQAYQAFGLVADTDDLLAIDGWTGAANRTSSTEGVNTLGWMVQSVVLDGANYKHYIYTDGGGLQLIDSGTDGAFNTDNTIEAALAIAGKPAGTTAGEMEVAAALIYNTALATGSDDLGGDHAAVSQYLYEKYLATTITNVPPTAVATATPLSGQAPLLVNFDGSASTDSDGTIVSYDWAWSTGSTSGVTPTTEEFATVGTYEVTLTVTDDANASATDIVTITVTEPNPIDDTPPVITILGDNPATVTLGESYADAGATATDDVDGSVNVSITGNTVDVNTVGTYLVTYSATDASNNTATATRTVNVVEDTPPGTGAPLATDLVLALETDAGVTATTGTVSAWADQSGQGNDLTGSGDPQIGVTTTPSGTAAIRLDGVGDWLDRTSGITGLPTAAAERTAFYVVNYVATANFAGLSYGTGASNQTFGLTTNGNGGLLTLQGYGSGNDVISDEPGTGAGWLVQSAVLAANGDFVHYKDGTEIESGNRTFNTVLSRIVIGEEIGGNGNGEELDVAAVLIYDRALTEAERQQVEAYLQNKYLDSAPPLNVPPVADNDAATTDEDTPVNINVLDGDTDSDGTIAGVTLIDGQTATVDQSLTLASGATATLLINGTIDYNPNGQFEALNDGESGSDSFTYTIEDDEGAASNAATVTVTVNGVTDQTGGGPDDNPVTSNLIASFESDFGIGSDAGTVTGWNDFFGSYNLTGVNGDPQLVPNGSPTGQDAIAFDGTDDFLRILGSDVDLSGLPGGAAPRTLYFVVDYKTMGEFTGFGYGDNQAYQAFGLVADTDELLALEGWTIPANRTSTTEGVNTLGWMVQSVVLDGANYKHYIYTDGGGLQLIDSGTDGAFNTDNTVEAALAIAGKPAGPTAGEMDVAAALIYNSALSTGIDNLSGDHAAVSQYLFEKYLDAEVIDNTPPVITVLGDNPAEVTLGEPYVDAGATATDNVDGPVSVTVTDNTVDVNTPGTYAVTYSATDAANNTATATRTVNVVEDTPPGTGAPLATDLVLALETDTGVTATTGTVAAWADQSGLGNDLTGSGDPQIGLTTTPSGAPAISLDGTGDWLDRSSDFTGLPTLAEERTVFFVVNYVATGSYAGFGYGTGSANQTFGLTTNGNDGLLTLQGWGNANDVISDEAGSGAGWLVQSAVLAANGDFVHYKDGSPIESGNRTYNTLLSRIVIGEEISGIGNGEEMDVAAVLVYDRALTDTEHQQVEAYLQNKYFNTATNTPPVADNDQAITDEDTPVNIDVLEGDTDSDGTVAGVTLINGQAATVNQPIVLVSGATATLLADGTIDYDPNGQFDILNDGESDSDTFTYTMEDNDGAASNAATVTVTVNGVTEAAPDLTLSVTRQAMSDQSGDYSIKLYQVGAATPDYDLTGTADATGEIIIDDIAPGTYEIAVKYPNCLQVVDLVTITGSGNTHDAGELRTGDVNDSNLVDIVDFSGLVASFNLLEADVNYNPLADFNGDGIVDIVDFSIMVSNFNVLGEVPSGTNP